MWNSARKNSNNSYVKIPTNTNCSRNAVDAFNLFDRVKQYFFLWQIQGSQFFPIFMAKISWYPSRRLGRPPSSQKCWIPHFTFLSLGHSYCFAYFSRLYVTLDTLFFQIIPLVAIIGAGVGGAVSYVGYMLLTKQDYRYSNIFIYSLCREKATKRSENYTFLTVTITELMSMQRRVGEPANARTHDIKFFNKSEQSCIATVAILFVWVRKGPLLLFTT